MADGNKKWFTDILAFSLKKDCRSISNSIVLLEFCSPVRILEGWTTIFHSQRAMMHWLAGGMLLRCISVHSPAHSLYSLGRWALFITLSREWKVKVLVAQYCPILWDTVDCSSPGSSIHGILQARILKWVAIFFTRDLPDPGTNLDLLHFRQILDCLRHQGTNTYQVLTVSHQL